MGGFLSPRKANTTLAQSEWEMFEIVEALGLVMVLVRYMYMDDVMCVRCKCSWGTHTVRVRPVACDEICAQAQINSDTKKKL